MYVLQNATSPSPVQKVNMSNTPATPFSFQRAGSFVTARSGNRRFQEINKATETIINGLKQQLLEVGVAVDVVPLAGAYVNTVALLGRTTAGANAHVVYNVLTPETDVRDVPVQDPARGSATLRGTPEMVVDATLRAALADSISRAGANLVQGVINPAGEVIWAYSEGNDPGLVDAVNASVNLLIKQVTDPVGANSVSLVNFSVADQIVADVQNGVPQGIDSSGYPLSAQLAVRISSQAKSAGQSPNAAQFIDLGLSTIVVDYLRADTSVQQPGGLPPRNYPLLARQLITLSPTNPAELEMALLGIAVSVAAGNNGGYKLPTLAANPLHDVGWLPTIGERSPYVSGLNGMATDTTAVTNVLAGLVNPTTVVQTLLVGMSTAEDVVLTPFVESSKGSVGADQQIRGAFKRLTGQDYSGPITLLTGTGQYSSDVIPAGYFDDRGGRQDFSQYLTLTAVAQQLQGDIGAIEQYCRYRTINAAGDPGHDGLARRVYLENYLMSAYGSRAPKFTGVKRLVTFHADFIQALLNAIRATAGEPSLRINNAFQASGPAGFNSSIGAALASGSLTFGGGNNTGSWSFAGRPAGRNLF